MFASRPSHHKPADIPTGYFLNPRHGYFSVVIPKEATNLITNPSVELATTGYAAFNGAAITRTATYQRHGTYSLSVIPAVSANCGVYYSSIALTAGTRYAFSLDVWGAAGRHYQAYFADVFGTRFSPAVRFTGIGLWQRVRVEWVATITQSYLLYLTKDNDLSTAVLYTDGWQCEAGTVSTYFDGDSLSFLRDDAAFYWTGTPHASTSFRSGLTGAGGTMTTLQSLGFKLLAVLGLGMAQVTPQFAAYGLLDGASYQRTYTPARAFTLAGQLAGRDLAALQQVRAGLVSALRPDRVPDDQPLLLLWQYANSCGDLSGEVIEIPCVYTGGLEGRLDNLYAERVGLSFVAPDPRLQAWSAEGNTLTLNVSVIANRIIRRGPDGVWSALGDGVDSGAVDIAIEGPDGRIYVGGTFDSVGSGVANTARIAVYDPATNTWAALGTGGHGGATRTYALAFDTAGNLYAGGTFADMGGVADTARIARWDGSVWNSMGAGGANDNVYTIVVGNDGTIYTGGLFTSIGGVAVARIAQWTSGGGFAVLGTGLAIGAGTPQANALVIGSDDNLYVGGLFDTFNGVTVNNVARWNGTTAVSLAGGANSGIAGLRLGPDGRIHAVGTFTIIGGISASRVAIWNGSGWTPMGQGINTGASEIVITHSGEVYVAGSLTATGAGLTLPDSMALWNGSEWVAVDGDMPGAAGNILALALGRDGSLYVGGNFSGAASVGAMTTLANTGDARAFPHFVFTGPGTVWSLINQTTGDGIWFDLTLLAGERATLTLRPGNIRFVSNFRSNLLGSILPGSVLASWRLQPGDNDTNLFITATTGDSAAAATWRKRYHGLDGVNP